MTMNILTGRGVSKADRKMVPMPANEQESKVDSVDEERLLKTTFAFAVRSAFFAMDRASISESDWFIDLMNGYRCLVVKDEI